MAYEWQTELAFSEDFGGLLVFLVLEERKRAACLGGARARGCARHVLVKQARADIGGLGAGHFCRDAIAFGRVSMGCSRRVRSRSTNSK